jgi:hypothetical protein
MEAIMLERSSIVKKKKKEILELTFPRKKRLFSDVTVCIAALCEGNIIVLAADRMITAADIEFEPLVEPPRIPVGKIVPLTTSIVAMTAGDVPFQSEAIVQVHRTVFRRVSEEPTNWWNVKDVVDLYVDFYNRDRQRRIRETILSPFELDQNTFISRQREMSEFFVRSISNQIAGFEMPDVATIVAGVDDSGAHVYRLYGGEAESCDSIGFASVGIGARHANSQFMLARHHRQRSFAETLLLTFVAKKRSEVAPGVGQQTEMVTMGPQRGTLFHLQRHEVMNRLEALNRRILAGERRAFASARRQIEQYVNEIREQGPTGGQQPPPEPPVTPNPPAT